MALDFAAGCLGGKYSSKKIVFYKISTNHTHGVNDKDSIEVISVINNFIKFREHEL